jgi:hypothetical protein
VSQVDTPAYLQACAIRLARLAADGTTPAGATNGYVTRNLIKMTVKPEIEAGQEFTIRDACGQLPVIYRDRDIIKRYAADIEFFTPDPEIEELMVGAPLITGTIGTTRTVADGTIVNGSTTVTSPTIAFVASDIGNEVSGTGIAAGATIVSIASGAAATMSAAATASTAGSLSLTMTAATRSIGAVAPPLGLAPTDNGVSIELWSKAVVGGSQVAVNPWVHWAYPLGVWTPGDRDHANDRMGMVFHGFLYENPGWGNGPWNDWGMPSPSTKSLTRAWGFFRSNDLPAVAPGYTAVPTQV